jgi:beta-galactosidase
MKTTPMVCLCALLAPLAALPGHAAQPNPPRIELAADSGWKFLLGDPGGAETRSFQDASWRTVNLPHDWSIESPPERTNPSAAGAGYFPAGIGWYRKTFRAPAAWRGKRVSVDFEGVYKDAAVYWNGRNLGTQPYGYTSFRFDLTEGLDFTAPNLLAVRVDNSAQPGSRWYSGSGIYRHVRVVVTEPAHVARWGMFVTAPEVASRAALISVRARIANEWAAEAGLTVEATLVDGAGKTVGNAQSKITVAAASESEARQEIAVSNPALSSPGSPVLYSVMTLAAFLRTGASARGT